MAEFSELVCQGHHQVFQVDECLYEDKTDHHHLIIFKNASFGRVMALDGIVQTTERDEFIYHEMMSHVPILAHGRARRVLVVGGGDGAMLREVLRHREVTRVTQIEIDRQVIELARRYLPNHSQGAFDDPRARIVIADGCRWVAETTDRFDVIIVDGTDPMGPGEALFQTDFYEACHRCLAPGGVMVTQNGVAFLQLDEVKDTASRLARLFTDWHFYTAPVPTYVGGLMTFAWASDDPGLRHPEPALLQKRYAAAGITTRYYTPECHLAAFALPRYIMDAIGK